MEKTYFKQLLDLAQVVDSSNKTVQYLYRDSLKRCLDFRDSYYEDTICWQNSSYVKRNLNFISECIELNK